MLRTITLILALSLIFAVAFPSVDAHIDTPLARHHAPAVHRMIKKRANSLLSLGNNDAAAGPDSNSDGVNNAAPAPNPPTPSGTDTSTPSSQSPAQPTDSKETGTGTATTLQTTPAPTQSKTASTTDGGLLGPILTPIIGGGQSANTSTSTSSSTPATSTSTSTSATSTSASSSIPTSASITPSNTPSADAQNESNSQPQITITSSASPSATSAAATSSGSVTKLQRNTIIILIAIGASIGAAGIIWTIIRKWKFRPSSSFEDRMQPIDWQPTTAPHGDHDITEKLSRNGSTRSHGSFTSGNNNHDNLTADLPSHDFTAGAAHLAPVGGYADLQRGPSPQPDLQRGPSFRSPSPYQYEIPNPHGQYYNNAGAGAGAYQGAYDHNRGY